MNSFNKSNLVKNECDRKIFKIFDVFAIGFVLLVMLFSFLFFLQENKSDLYAEISVNGKLYKTVNLSKVTQPYEVVVDGNLFVKIFIENDGVSIIESDCKDKICINTGKITKAGQSSVCLPAEVSVSLQSQTKAYDSITR